MIVVGYPPVPLAVSNNRSTLVIPPVVLQLIVGVVYAAVGIEPFTAHCSTGFAPLPGKLRITLPLITKFPTEVSAMETSETWSTLTRYFVPAAGGTGQLYVQVAPSVQLP